MSEAGFGLTELIAGLLVASLLIVGLIDVTRRVARVTHDMKTSADRTSDERILSMIFRAIERADPDSIKVEQQRIVATVGNDEIVGNLIVTREGVFLDWKSPQLSRRFSLSGDSRFQGPVSGMVMLTVQGSSVPIAFATLRRTVPFDCMFDTIARDCV